MAPPPKPHTLDVPPQPGQAALTPEPSKDEHRITFGDRNWRIRGLAKNTSYRKAYAPRFWRLHRV